MEIKDGAEAYEAFVLAMYDAPETAETVMTRYRRVYSSHEQIDGESDRRWLERVLEQDAFDPLDSRVMLYEWISAQAAVERRNHAIRHAVSLGEEAFWLAVGSAFPAAKSGDLDLGLAFELERVAEKAVTAWVASNVPSEVFASPDPDEADEGASPRP